MLERDVIERIRNRTTDILNKAGAVKDVTPIEEVALPRVAQADLLFKVDLGSSGIYTLLFEVKSSGNPRYAQQAISQLRTVMQRRGLDGERVYGVFGAPFISEGSRQICRDGGIGFVDIAGNCLLQFGDTYINIEGHPNPFPATRPLGSLFSRKSSRVVRAMLLDPGRKWYVTDLAEETGISLGQASNVKARLLEYDFLLKSKSTGKVRFQLKNPRQLLEKWAESYDYRVNQTFDYYSMDGVRDVEERMIDYFNRNEIPYALTLTSGAARVAPYLRYSRAFAYVDVAVWNVAPALDFKEVSSGPTVTLLQPYDEGVFYGLQDVGGAKVVSDVQLYLDLKSYKGRGEEAAEFLLKTRLEKKW